MVVVAHEVESTMFRELLQLLRWTPAVPVDERREGLRLRCRFGALMHVGDSWQTVTVVNVTLTGLGLESESSFRVGTQVELCRDGFGEPLQATVSWCRARRGGEGYRLGLQYQADPAMLLRSWLRPALRQAGFQAEFPGEQRRLVRIPGRVACQLQGLTGESYCAAEMRDLSLGGALVESPISFPVGLSLGFVTAPLGGLPVLQGLAKVASCQLQEEGLWRCGLTFRESQPDAVRQYMAAMLRSARKSPDFL